MLRLEISKWFLITTIGCMFFAEVLIKGLIAAVEYNIRVWNKKRSEDVIEDAIAKVRGLYWALPIIAGIILTLCFLPTNHGISKQLTVIFFIYFTGGDLAIYMYFFKTIIRTIDKVIEKWGDSTNVLSTIQSFLGKKEEKGEPSK